MEYRINVLSILPVRSKPDHRSEMVNQLLFGEQFSVIEELGDWQHIESVLDAYKGWVTKEVSLPLDHEPGSGNPKRAEITPQPLRVNPVGSPNNSFLILPGSSLPGLDTTNGIFSIGNIKYQAHGSFKDLPNSCSGELIAQTASIFLNSPYVWGGRSLFGVDCSGLVQVVYKICGIALPRDASQQVLKGKAISFISEAQPGDLAFFANPDEEISHVGIVLDQQHIIHASGKVRIDRLDHQGIYQEEEGRYSHTLRVIHRHLD